MAMHKKTNNLDYSWIVLVMGVFVVFGALGLGRYGYSMVLPLMQADLGMDNAQTGLLAGINLAGYLAFALIGGALATRFGIRMVASTGLLVAGVAMVFTGLADGLFPVATWRGMTGLGSGAANVAIMGLWAAWFTRERRGFASGIAVSGSSLGLIFTGLFVPWLISLYGDSAWRTSWYIFGGMAIALAVCAYIILRNSPADKKVIIPLENGKVVEDSKAGSGEKPGVNESALKSDTKHLSPKAVKTDHKNLFKSVYLSAKIWWLGFVYVAFGFSYIIYMTYFVNFLISENNYTATEAGNLFMIMGWLSLLCGIIWGTLSDYIGRRNALIILFLIHTTAFGLFAVGSSPVYFIVSAVLYGLTAWSIPAIMAAACGDMLGSRLAPAALGFITLFFGIGQAVGPVVGGAMADITGSFTHSFLLSAAVALLGAGGSAFLIKQ